MQPPESLVTVLADLCVTLAEGAGEVARSGRASAFAVDSKSTPTDIVTEVDHRVERWLREQIAAARPEDAILGEEAGSTSGRSGVRWVLDPIDGTVNFMLGSPQYAVSVAAEVDGEVVAGCVHAPVAGESFQATRGRGAWLREPGDPSRADQRLAGPRAVPLERAVIGTGFSYEAQRRSRQAGVVSRLIPRIADIRRAGSSSLDICAVASGRLDGYFESGLHRWDYAAGLLIAREAGCAVSGLRRRDADELMTVVAGQSFGPDLFATLEELGADLL